MNIKGIGLTTALALAALGGVAVQPAIAAGGSGPCKASGICVVKPPPIITPPKPPTGGGGGARPPVVVRPPVTEPGTGTGTTPGGTGTGSGGGTQAKPPTPTGPPPPPPVVSSGAGVCTAVGGCATPTPATTPQPPATPTPGTATPAPQPPPTQAQITQLIAQIQLPKPQIGSAPCSGAGCMGAVGVPVWMWHQTMGPITDTITINGYSLAITARPGATTWSMGDGHTVTCQGAGTPYSASMGWRSSPDCGYKYLNKGRYQLQSTQAWTVTWTGVVQGSIPWTTDSSRQIVIGEYQAIRQ